MLCVRARERIARWKRFKKSYPSLYFCPFGRVICSLVPSRPSEAKWFQMISSEFKLFQMVSNDSNRCQYELPWFQRFSNQFQRFQMTSNGFELFYMNLQLIPNNFKWFRMISNDVNDFERLQVVLKPITWFSNNSNDYDRCYSYIIFSHIRIHVPGFHLVSLMLLDSLAFNIILLF